MRIALIDPSLFTLPYDAMLVGGLRRAGQEVTFFGKAASPPDPVAASIGVRGHFYPELLKLSRRRWAAPFGRLAKGCFHVSGMARLLAALERERPDVIHFQWLPLPLVDGLFLDRLRRIAPLVVTAHDSRPFNANPSSIAQSLGAVSVLSRFDRVIVHTEQAVGRLASAGVPADALARIPHGFLDEGQKSVPPVTAMDRPVRFLLFGKIKPYKGVDLLLEAVRRLPLAERVRLELRVVGRPYMKTEPLAEAAAALLPSVRLEFRHVPDHEIGALFDWSDVLVFPYREIDMSGVLMAALNTGRPIVASRIGGFAELLRHGEHGLLVPPGDVDGLSRALGLMVRQPELRRAMGEAVVRLADSIPSWDRIASLTVETYEAARAAAGRYPSAAAGLVRPI